MNLIDDNLDAADRMSGNFKKNQHILSKKFVDYSKLVNSL